jgi:hypothetical protein
MQRFHIDITAIEMISLTPIEPSPSTEQPEIVLVDGSYKRNRVCPEGNRVISENALFDSRHGSVADDCVKELYVARCCTDGSSHFLPLESLSFHVAGPMLASRCSLRIRARAAQSPPVSTATAQSPMSSTPASPNSDISSHRSVARISSHCAEYARRLYGKDLSVWIESMPVADRLQLVEKVIMDCARALGHLHERYVIHGDVKVQNMLMLDKHSPLVMIDFGLARMNYTNTNTDEHQQVVGTYSCRAPESVMEGVMLPASDIFALGVAVIDWIGARDAIMIENDESESDNEYRMFMERFRRAPARFSLGKHAIRRILGRDKRHARTIGLLRDMLHFDPSKRPTAKEIVARLHDIAVAEDAAASTTAAAAATVASALNPTIDTAVTNALVAADSTAAVAAAVHPPNTAAAASAAAAPPLAAPAAAVAECMGGAAAPVSISATQPSYQLRARKRRAESEDLLGTFAEAVVADMQARDGLRMARGAAVLFREHIAKCHAWIESTCQRHSKPCLITATLKFFWHVLLGQPGAALIADLQTTVPGQHSGNGCPISVSPRWFDLAACSFLFVDALVYTNTVRVSRVVAHTPGMQSTEECRSVFTRFMDLYEWDYVFTNDDFSATPAQWARTSKHRSS